MQKVAFKTNQLGNSKQSRKSACEKAALVAYFSALVGCSKAMGHYLQQHRQMLDEDTVEDVRLEMAKIYITMDPTSLNRADTGGLLLILFANM
jgi:hypothetical protein